MYKCPACVSFLKENTACGNRADNPWTVIACATVEIISEYEEIVQKMIDRKQKKLDRSILTPLIIST